MGKCRICHRNEELDETASFPIMRYLLMVLIRPATSAKPAVSTINVIRGTTRLFAPPERISSVNKRENAGVSRAVAEASTPVIISKIMADLPP